MKSLSYRTVCIATLLVLVASESLLYGDGNPPTKKFSSQSPKLPNTGTVAVPVKTVVNQLAQLPNGSLDLLHLTGDFF